MRTKEAFHNDRLWVILEDLLKQTELLFKVLPRTRSSRHSYFYGHTRWVGGVSSNMFKTRTFLAGSAGFLTCLVVGTVIAMAMGPFVAPRFGVHIRDPQTDGLLMPALLTGYAVIAAGVVWLQRVTAPASRGVALRQGMVLGWIVFVGDHMITAGWSQLDAPAMLASGFADAFAVAAASWITYIVLGARHAAE